MAPRTLASAPVNFGDKFDPLKMKVLMDHISRMTAEIQKIQQLLADGTVGQVLTKTDRGDYQGRWSAPAGPDLPPNSSGLARGECFVTSANVTLDLSVMGAGYWLHLMNSSGSPITITQGSGVTLYGPLGSIGSHTIDPHGFASIWCQSASVAKIYGEVS